MSQNNELPPLPEPDWHDCKPMDAAHRPFYTADHMKAYARAAQATVLRGTDAQILKERELTVSAIQGAMAYGYQNGEYPPEDAAWLRPFWELGRRDAEIQGVMAAQAGHSEPVAAISGVFAGRVTVELTDKATVLPTGTALYTHPAPVRQPISDFDAADSFMTEPHTDDVFAAYQQGIRFAERHHGITAQKGRT